MALDRATSAEETHLLVPGMACARCMITIESCLSDIPGVSSARANLTAHTVRVQAQDVTADHLVDALSEAGFAARPFDPELHGAAQSDKLGRDLLLRLGVAGFAAMNVMLLSISVWSGAEAATRDLLHWISALIALPAMVFAGMPFYRSAVAALAGRRINMDVPISLAIFLSAIGSLVETSQGGAHAYFDAGIMLIFFLLIGRYLEHRTRATARSAAAELMAMTGRHALRRTVAGRTEICPTNALLPGDVIEITPGERIAADGEIIEGESELDRSLITGESVPEPAQTSDTVHAGMLNLTGAIAVRVNATGDKTLLAEISRMIDAAKRGRGAYDRLADRAARIYAPGVHILAALAFFGWYLHSGDLRTALQIATAVLIVTCPCALALAVPTVHTVASGRLFRQGIFLKNGDELERLAEVDRVLFDKTGTLTLGEPRVIEAPSAADPAWPFALALAEKSHHPFSRAIVTHAEGLEIKQAELCAVREVPGKGILGMYCGQEIRLGRPGWAAPQGAAPGVYLEMPDRPALRFAFSETLRPDARDTILALGQLGLAAEIISGDQSRPVSDLAAKLDIRDWHARMMPSDKLAYLSGLGDQGHKILMVGDGLNDSPVLAAAHASISPASAADVAKTAAGLVFTGHSLMAVLSAIETAGTARRRTLQSFAIALCYNTFAIPLALAGVITPLLAAAAMSTSSILVVLNALRMKAPKDGEVI